jgi:DNA adenine methylase
MAIQTHIVPAAQPFLKWPGGKTQLLNEFNKCLPKELKKGKITKYVEPFVGGGAVFFYLNREYSIEKCYLCDINEELILSYRTIKRSVKKLISELNSLESDYLPNDEKKREEFYYKVRSAFNQKLSTIDFSEYSSEWVERTAQIIFLNHTCYNGLFRVNMRGEFNASFGKYKNPNILNEENLNEVATFLKKTKILLGDFTQCREFVDDKTFVYFDPPYRPLNQTSSFTSYSKDRFCEQDQIRLADFFKELDEKGAKIMLSNSDPKNENSNDSYFDELFSNYHIERVPAKRMINCKGNRRGDINELIITNY